MRHWLVFVVGTAVLMGAGIAVGSTTAVSSGLVSTVVTAGGVALFVWALGTSRRERVERQLPGFSQAFEVVVPCERTAVGRAVQLRLTGESRRQWAPGLLGVTRGAAAFVPARPKHADRAWGGDVISFETGSILGQGSYLRLHTPEGALQFALQITAQDLSTRVAPWLSPAPAVPGPATQPVLPNQDRPSAGTDPATGTNLRVLASTGRDPEPGDVFALAPPGDAYLFGRVISTRAQWSLADNSGPAVLIYLYREGSPRREVPAPAAMRPDQLLGPPLLTNLLPWRQGVFEVLGNVPLRPGDVLDPHCFRAPGRDRYVDGFGRELPGPVEPVGVLGLHSLRSIDDLVSDALGIPRAP